MKNIFRILILVLAANTYSYGQCEFFAKKSTLGKLKPYLNTQQVFSTVLLNDDKTKISGTFYFGEEYRILVTAEKQLGKIQLNIRDAQDNIVFTTKGYGIILWDFNVESMQDLTLEIVTPPAPENQTLDKSGCVSVIIGFKQ